MKKNRRTQIMSGVYMIVFIAIFLIISGRFLYIQASGKVSNVSLEELAKQKRSTYHTIKSERGKIYDTNGMTLAYDRPTFKLYAILDENFTISEDKPKHVNDIKSASELLAPVLGVEQSFIFEILKSGIDNKKFQVEFGNPGKNLSQKTKEEIKQLNIPGMNFEQESIRYYPNGLFASHIIGFARKEQLEENEEEEQEERKMVGITGIEKEMDSLLGGEDGFVSYERDGYLNKLLYPNETVQQPNNGSDIYLTIDQKIQITLEDMLSQVEEEYTPERITAIVMNAKTGEVLAMSNRPSYDPNNPVDVQNWYNDVISTPYEPGSTVKMFTWAAAIDAGVYNGTEKYKSGRYQINPVVDPVRDHNQGKGWGSISFDEGFHRSSNVAASMLVWEKLGPDQYLDYLKRFDLDKKTDIDLPGEIAGQILYNWPIEKLTTSFGQGSTLTPIQQVKAATAIANEGKMLQPYIIKKVIDHNSEEIIEQNEPSIVGEPISSETAEQVLHLLKDVVHSEDGTGRIYELNDYTVAGKTGTAEMPNPDGPGYLKGRENAIFSFLGMAPAEDPELIMYVSVTKPNLPDYEHGSVPVSHIFKNVMENSLRYLDITPDKESDLLYETVIIPEVIGKNTTNVEKQLRELGLNITVVGEGDQIQQASVQAGKELFTNDHVLLITNKPTMPNIIGWSLRDTLQFAHLLQLKVETIGNGYIVKQSIEKGVRLKQDDYLGVELAPPNGKINGDNEEAEQTNE